MEGAGGTCSRLLIVLAVVAGLLVGGSSGARAAALRAPAAGPTASAAGSPASVSGSTGTPRSVSRTGGAERATLAAPGAPTSCGGDCAVTAGRARPDRRAALVARPPRAHGAPVTDPAPTWQDRAPPPPAGH